MKKTIKILNRDVYVDLEIANYLKNNLLNIISFMVKNNMTDTEQFARYNKKLIDISKDFDKAHAEFSQNYVMKLAEDDEKILGWHLNFESQTLEYTVEIIEED